MNNPQLPLGFLGGAFDPVHIGHLRGAMAVRDTLNLERVDLIPAAQSPLKNQATVDAVHRLAMLELAVADLHGIAADCRELDRPGPSYTVDTLEGLRHEYGAERTLVWIIGADILATLPQWSRWRQLLDFAHLVVMGRPDAAPHPSEVSAWLEEHKVNKAGLLSRPGGGVFILAQPLLDISSSDIRAMLAAGRDPRFLLPDAVMEYISDHALFSRDLA
jgi:nicotinate-nucleotide adenylyltransferase